MSILKPLLIPPHLRRPFDLDPNVTRETIPVSVERSDLAQGANNQDVTGNFAKTWQTIPITIVNPTAIAAGGDFTAAVKTFNMPRVVDHFFFSPPPDGLIYCVSFHSTISFELDTVTGIFRPSADFFFSHIPGFPAPPIVFIPLNRKRQRGSICIWTNRAVPAYSVKVNLGFANFGGVE